MDGSLTIEVSPVDVLASEAEVAEPSVIAPSLSYLSDEQLDSNNPAYESIDSFCGAIEKEIRLRLDIENRDWVECSVETEKTGDVLVARGYDLRHPGCLTEDLAVGRPCVYTSGHNRRLWAKASISTPSDGNEPNHDFVTGDMDEVIETALDTDSFYERKMVADAYLYYNSAVKPRVSEQVQAWWSALNGRALSRETILSIGEHLMESCRFEGHYNEPPRFDGFPYVEYPDFYQVAVMIDWRPGDDFLTLEFAYYNKNGEWTEMDSVTVEWE